MEPTASPRAELSSIATVLDDLSLRVTTIAERSTGTELDWLATDLFEVERKLGEGGRRLRRALDRMR